MDKKDRLLGKKKYSVYRERLLEMPELTILQLPIEDKDTIRQEIVRFQKEGYSFMTQTTDKHIFVGKNKDGLKEENI